MKNAANSVLSLETLDQHMVYVEGGTFEMGGKGRYDGKSIHTVRLRSFYLCQYLVSQRLYQGVIGRNSTAFPHPDRPVERVSWYEAIEFCNKLSQKTGLKPYYRINKNSKDLNNQNNRDRLKWNVSIISGANGYHLPTEIEWEYAAKGGIYERETVYAGSANVNEVAWHDANSHNLSQLQALRRPNSLGLYDMSGNVLEWCWDWYDGSYYQACEEEGVVTNPIGPPLGSSRVVRGGAWSYLNGILRVVYRLSNNPNSRLNDIGFRLSRY